MTEQQAVGLTVDDVAAIHQGGNGFLVGGEGQDGRPLEVSTSDVIRLNGKFKAFVGAAGHVLPHGETTTAGRRQLGTFQQNVGSQGLVNIGRYVDAVPQTDIHTNVRGLGDFPTQGLVGNVRTKIVIRGRCFSEGQSGIGNDHTLGAVIGNTGIAGHPVTSPEFQVGQRAGQVFHESLIRHPPSGRDRGKVGPTMPFGKHGGTIVAVGELKQVTSLCLCRMADVG